MIRSELLKSLAETLHHARPLLFRNDHERSFLDEWFSGDSEHAAETAAADENDIRSIIANCRICSGTGEKKMPYGSGESGMMIVLNPPALLSSGEMNYFKKDSRDLLFRIIIKALELEPETVYITNLLKCSMKEAMRPSEFYENCLEILSKEIELTAPKTVLVMGDMLPLRKVRKKAVHCNWFEIPHPVLMIQTPDLKRQAWETLKLVKRTLDE